LIYHSTSRREGADGDEKNHVFVKMYLHQNPEQRNHIMYENAW